jgi:Lrp/AsnC family leucine-responsive transcriptional regulator
MDRIDRKILRELQEDGRLTNADLAARVSLTPSPCLRRVRQLEQDDVIRGYRAVLDPAALGRGFQSFATVVMRYEDHETIAEFERQVAGLPEVIEAHRLFGDPDYRFRTDVLTTLPGVGQLTSHLAMKEVKANTGIPTGA